MFCMCYNCCCHWYGSNTFSNPSFSLSSLSNERKGKLIRTITGESKDAGYNWRKEDESVYDSFPSFQLFLSLFLFLSFFLNFSFLLLPVRREWEKYWEREREGVKSEKCALDVQTSETLRWGGRSYNFSPTLRLFSLSLSLWWHFCYSLASWRKMWHDLIKSSKPLRETSNEEGEKKERERVRRKRGKNVASRKRDVENMEKERKKGSEGEEEKVE